MKKEYINPHIEVLKIETAQMIAVSGGLDTTPSNKIDNPDDFGAPYYDFGD